MVSGRKKHRRNIFRCILKNTCYVNIAQNTPNSLPPSFGNSGNPANICTFKVNNKNGGKTREIYSKLTKTPERCQDQRQGRPSGLFIVNFEHCSPFSENITALLLCLL